jgi:nitrile hydratase accessory protein
MTGGMTDQEEPRFAEPWHADAFALVTALIEAGVISPAEWSDALAAAIHRAQAAGDPDLGDSYYEHWTAALADVCAAHGLISTGELAAGEQAWHDAYARTPHGQPVELT